MKKTIILIAVLVLLGVLVVVYVPFTPSQPRVGGDKDPHGCIASAGYTYSAVRQGCIRVWEQGVALTPVVQNAEPVLAAYVVQNENGTRAEVFRPGLNEGMVMTRNEQLPLPTWTAPGGWTLTYEPDPGWKLAQGGQLLYASKAQ
ncbi:MAG: hypothetical protein J6X06_05650 [Elusimicrobiaceae bacterium]|nr:hypothetical protein [Elusimicrobiaceae bacterium]